MHNVHPYLLLNPRQGSLCDVHEDQETCLHHMRSQLLPVRDIVSCVSCALVLIGWNCHILHRLFEDLKNPFIVRWYCAHLVYGCN